MSDVNDVQPDVAPGPDPAPPVSTPKSFAQSTQAALADDARTNAAARLARGATKGQQGIPYTPEPLPAPQSKEDYAQLPSGADFLSPEGEKLVKPYYPKTEDEYEAVPAGAKFVSPDGKKLTKPTYEGISSTAQTYYDMARSDRERFKILNDYYPGKVKKAGSKLYVDDEGTLRKPGQEGKGTDLVVPFLASSFLPTAGAIGGSAVSPWAGTAGGAMLGEGANALIMQLSGYYDRTGEEAAIGAAESAGSAVIGTAAGRAATLAISAVPAIREIARGRGAKVAASILGAIKDDVDMAYSMASKGEHESASWLMRKMGMTDPGVVVPTSSFLKGAPILQNITDAYEKALNPADPMGTSIANYYRKAVEKLLGQSGAKVEGDVLNPTSAIPTIEAGEQVINKAREQIAVADANLETSMNALRLSRAREMTDMMPQGFSIAEEAAANPGQARVFNLYDSAGRVHFRGEIRPTGTPGEWEVSSVRNPSRRNSDMSPAMLQAISRNLEARGETLVAGTAQSRTVKAAREASAQKGLTTTERGAHPIRAVPSQDIALAELKKAQQTAANAAQDGVDVVFGNLKHDAAVFDHLDGLGYDTGDFTRAFVQSLRNFRNGISETASRNFYQPSEVAARGRKPEQSGLVSFARNFYDELPNVFRDKHTPIANDIKALGGGKDAHGKWEDAPEEMTFAQLRKIKSYLNRSIDWDDLTPDVVDGTYKTFAKRIDDILHDGRASPELKEAARLADAGDEFYARNMGPLNHLQFSRLMSTMKGNLPPDPEVLHDTFIKSGQTEVINQVKKMVGGEDSPLWHGVKAARLRSMFKDSVADANTETGGVPDAIDYKKFAAKVSLDYQKGVLEPVFGEADAKKLVAAAHYGLAQEGYIDLPVRPGDNVTTLINRARALTEATKEAAKNDPMALLESEMQGVERQMRDAAAADRKKDPLDFLTNPSMGAANAMNSIMESPDLIMAAGVKFGDDSLEMQAIRTTYLRRLLQNSEMEPYKTLFPSNPKGVRPGGSGIEERVQKQLFPGSSRAVPLERSDDPSAVAQQLLFPGVRREDVLTIAKEMRFLFSTDVMDMARGMSAQSRLNNPWSQLPAHDKVTALRYIPFVGTAVTWAARETLRQTYQLIRRLATSPSTMRMLRKGLEENSDYAAKAAARAELRKQYKEVVGKMGAVTGPGIAGRDRSNRVVDMEAIGAQQGSDGRWVLPDPEREGGFLHVE